MNPENLRRELAGRGFLPNYLIGRMPESGFGRFYPREANLFKTYEKRRFRRGGMCFEPRRIFVLNLGGMGDVILGEPGLRALADQYKGATIDLMVLPHVKDAVKLLSVGANQIEAPLTGFAPGARGRGRNMKAVLQWAWSMHRRSYDLVLNMRTLESLGAGLRMSLLFSLLGGQVWAGRNTERRGFFYNVGIRELDDDTIHEVDYSLMLAWSVGATGCDREIRLRIPPEEEKAVAPLAREIFRERQVLCLNPGSGWPSRKWPSGRFAEAANEIAKRFDMDVMLCGSPRERELTERIESEIKVRAHNVAGKTTICGLAALLRKCALFITNDTGSMHLAAVFGVPTVAVFGPGDCARYWPPGDPSKIRVVYRGAPCAPCLNVECEHLSCLRAVSVEMVVDAAVDLLQKLPLQTKDIGGVL